VDNRDYYGDVHRRQDHHDCDDYFVQISALGFCVSYVQGQISLPESPFLAPDNADELGINWQLIS
jgi:hypothetical protein